MTSAHGDLFISFTVSGLIALTYSMLSVQWLSLCVIYPRLWCDRQGFRETAALELRAVPQRLRLLQVLARGHSAGRRRSDADQRRSGRSLR